VGEINSKSPAKAALKVPTTVSDRDAVRTATAEDQPFYGNSGS
jgi:hypothetical protein